MDSATGVKKDLPEPKVQENSLAGDGLDPKVQENCLAEEMRKFQVQENSLAEEMKKLPKVRTSILTVEEEKCTTVNENEVVIACPQPRRLVARSDGELCEQKSADLSDLLVPTDVSDDTPPYFSGSPPPRCSNPHVRDARFSRQF